VKLLAIDKDLKKGQSNNNNNNLPAEGGNGQVG